MLLINTSDSTIKLSNSMYIRQHLGVAASLAEVLTSLSEVLTKERLNFVLSKIPGEDPRLKTCLLIYLLIENDFVFSGKDLIVYSLFSILIALPEESTEHEYNSLHLAIYGLLDIYGFVNDCNVDAEYKVIKSFVDAICNCIKTNPQCNEGGLDLDILKDYMIKTLDQKTELQHVSAGTNNTLSELGVTAQCNASYCSII